MATTEIIRHNGAALAAVPEVPKLDAGALEKVLLQGDLSALRPSERLSYYKSVCESVGLNALTRPFEYLMLGKGDSRKLTLYATRACTEQLRQINNVSVTVTSRQIIEDCFVVTARAKMPNGREDESIGAVGIANLKGEERSNAMMKAETKAKRRVTLSICGLAFLDENEVEAVRGAYHIPVDMETGEIPELAPAPTLQEDIVAHPPRAKKSNAVNFDALKYFGEVKKRFKRIHQEPAYYEVLKRYNVEHANEFGTTVEARACYKELQLRVADLEAEHAKWVEGLPKYAEWPDSPTDEALVVAGKVYFYNNETGSYKELK